MNVDPKNQKNFAKKKKIIVISLSAVVIVAVSITLITGFFLMKKNKESRYENDDLREVINEDNENNENNNNDDNKNDSDNENENENNNNENENDDKNENENDDVIVNESDYFFNKTSSQVTMNILLFFGTGILFFIWENDKASREAFITEDGTVGRYVKEWLNICFYGKNIANNAEGSGIFEKTNWFGFGTLVPLIVTTLLVEFVLNHFLLGSLSHLLSKDKNKRYSRTLMMFWKKRKRFFSSYSKTKIFFTVINCLLNALLIAMVARVLHRSCSCCFPNGIIEDHGKKYCCCCCKAQKNKKISILNEFNNDDPGILREIPDRNQGQRNDQQNTKQNGGQNSGIEMIKDEDNNNLLSSREGILFEQD